MRAPAPLPDERSCPFLVHSSTPPKRRRWMLVAGIIAGAILATGIVLLIGRWPFTRQAVVRDLEQATSTTVEIRAFRRTYLPHPGAVAEDVVFRHGHDPRTPPLGTIRRLTVQSSYTGMLRHHVSLLRAEGLHAAIRLGESFVGDKNSSKTVIDQLQADGAILDFLPAGSVDRLTRFEIRQFRVHDLGSHGAMAFQIAALNPKPRGEVRASGRLGPWRSDDPRQTDVSGTYSFRHADLTSLPGIGGVLSSEGNFHGPLAAVEVDGATDSPDFAVASVAHPEYLSTRFHAVVNATKGDVMLRTADAKLGDTAITATGNVAPMLQQRGKTASLDFLVQEGRIQDLLWLFMKSPHPLLAGVTSFKAHATLPPGHERFLRKLVFEADFGIDDARFTKLATEQQVTQLSERARSDKNPPPDAETVLSNLKGHVELRLGVAHFSTLSFTVPGAVAHLHGTYDLITKRVNLRGTVQTSAKLSDTTPGVKSFLMKVIGRFKNSDHPGAPLPISIVGTYPHPAYRIHPIHKGM